MKAVFDTNILFSAVGWRGAPYHCVQYARHGGCQLVLCWEILDELEEKLMIKRGMTSDAATEIIEEFLAISHCVRIENTVHEVVPDPDDDMVLECALVGGADCIVSGDHHLLGMVSWRGIEILTAAQFLRQGRAH